MAMISRPLKLKAQRNTSLLTATSLRVAALLLASSPTFPAPFASGSSFAALSLSSRASAFVIAAPSSSPAFSDACESDQKSVPARRFGFRAATRDAMSTGVESARGPDHAPAAGVSSIRPSALSRLSGYAASFSATNGLQVERSGVGGGHVAAPISLLPQAYPRSLFERAKTLAALFNELVDRVGRNGIFLKETLRDVRGVDEYTGKLLDMYEEVYLGERNGLMWGRHARSADRLGIQRSDYMLHRSESNNGQGEYSLKQVELNTIASSFAGLASTVARLHRFLTKRMGKELEEFLAENQRAVMGKDGSVEGDGLEGGVPESPAMKRLPAAISIAYGRYCERNPSNDAIQPIVLFVVQPNETNTVDQRMLEFALWDNHEIPVVRMSLAEIYQKVSMDESSGRLALGGIDGGAEQEVAVVYFRAGYAPNDYPSGYNTEDGSGIEWLARERLERSCAAKCPSLGYHLAGTKKVQQELARPGVVERFFPENVDDVSSQIRTAFAGLYSLGADANKDDKNAVKEVFQGGEGRYVLKPQREGGGYNYYGENLANKLRKNCALAGDGETMHLSPDLSEFILMERLFPPEQRAILLREGCVEGTGMTISELGCFGTIITSGEGNVVHNEYAGFLLRTKFSSVDEGGVASGFATLSSPYLC